MDVYLIFGDPRRDEKRTVLSAVVPDTAVSVHPVIARVSWNDRDVEGAIVASHTAGPLVLQVSDLPAHPSALDALTAAGWVHVPQPDLPAPQTLPISVEVTLATTSPRLRAWTRMLWMPRFLVSGQRSTLDLGDGIALHVRCLAMAPVRGDRPRALLLLEPGTALPDLTTGGWLPIPPVAAAPRWESLIRATEAVSPHVQYLLDAPIVTGADIVGSPADLTEDDWLEGLDPDVLDAAILALDEQDRGAEVPLSVRQVVQARRDSPRSSTVVSFPAEDVASDPSDPDDSDSGAS